MRAVADDQLASMSVGISVQRVFALAWAVAGLTAAAAGIVVGAVSGLNQDGLIAIGLAVFPAVILGGLDSVPGAVVGGHRYRRPAVFFYRLSGWVLQPDRAGGGWLAVCNALRGAAGHAVVQAPRTLWYRGDRAGMSKPVQAAIVGGVCA